jgi:hypothetical protein
MASSQLALEVKSIRRVLLDEAASQQKHPEEEWRCPRTLAIPWFLSKVLAVVISWNMVKPRRLKGKAHCDLGKHHFYLHFE